MGEENKLTPKELTMNLIEWMSIGGCSPFEKNSKRRFIGYICVWTTVVLVILTLIQFIVSKNHSINSFVDTFVMIFGFTQIGAKYLTTIQKAKFLANMLETVWKDFWSLDVFDEKFKKNALILYNRTNFLGNVYSLVTMLTCLLLIVQAGLNRALVVEIWFPYPEVLKLFPYYEIMFVFQGFFLFSSVWFAMIQLDRMFILLTCFICTQKKMIRFKLSAISRANSKLSNSDIVRDCVVHHNILFRFLQNFEIVYSRLLLPTVGTNFILVSLAMYGALTEASLNRQLTLIFVYLTCIGQLFAYCFAGHLIKEEGMRIGEAAYNTDWYNLDNRSVKMSLFLIIVRSQRKIELTVGGLLILSLENFAAVVRASFSFLTFMINARK